MFDVRISGSPTNKHIGSKESLLKNTSATRNIPTVLNCRTDPHEPGPGFAGAETMRLARGDKTDIIIAVVIAVGACLVWWCLMR